MLSRAVFGSSEPTRCVGDIRGRSVVMVCPHYNYNADQSRFLRVVQSVFLQRRKLDLADLYEEPFTNFGANAVEKLFGQNEITELIELTKRLAA